MVKCACLFFVGKISARVECSAIVDRLSCDFNWRVRNAVAQNISGMKLKNKLQILEDLVLDEERDVVTQSTTALADMIVKGGEHGLVQRYETLVKDQVVKPTQAILRLPEIFTATGNSNSELTLSVLNNMVGAEYDRQMCAYAIGGLTKCFGDKF